MVKFSYYKGTNKIKCKLPTSYAEITIETYLKIDELIKKIQTDSRVYISLLSGVEYEDLEQFPIDVITSLTDAIRFIWYEEAVWVKSDHFINNNLEFKPIGELYVIQFEHWKKKYSELQDDVLLVPYTVSLLRSGEYIYSQRIELLDILKLPADIGVYCKNFYNIGFAEHQKKYAPLYEGHSPDAEEEEAGYETLSKWEFYSTLHSMADGDILKKERIALMSVDEVYTHLSYQKTEAQYIKNYRKVLDNAIQRGNRID